MPRTVNGTGHSIDEETCDDDERRPRDGGHLATAASRPRRLLQMNSGQALEFDTFERSLRSVCRQTSVICRTRPPEDAHEPGKAPAPPPRFTPQNPSRKCDSRPAGRSGPYIHLRDGLTAPDAAIGPFRPHRFSSFVLERGSARCRIEVSGDPARELRCRAIHWHNSSVDTRAACATCG